MLNHLTNEHVGWTEDRVETLKKRWQDGASAGEIARELGGGLSRSGVLGKVNRLTLAKRKNPSTAPKPKPPKRHGNAGQPQAAAIVHNLTMRKLPTLPLPMEDGVDVTHLIGVLQLTDRRCRWPHGDPLTPDFGFCGQLPQAGSPYCPIHHRRAYTTI